MPFEKKIIATIDTETCGLGNKMQVYDFGYVIHDKQGNVLAENHGLIREVFTDAKQMMGAYYSAKVFTHYAELLDAGTIHLHSWNDMAQQFADDCEEHKVNVFAAYNLGFDTRAIKITSEALGRTKKFLPYNMQTLCLWRFACETIFKSNNYYALARQEGWQTPAGNYMTNAECAYRYLKPDWRFVEDHTALSDARIETQIAAKCFGRKKAVPYDLGTGAGWRIAQPS